MIYTDCSHAPLQLNLTHMIWEIFVQHFQRSHNKLYICL